LLSWVPTQVLREGLYPPRYYHLAYLQLLTGSALAKDPAIVQALKGVADLFAAGTIRITVADNGAGYSSMM